MGFGLEAFNFVYTTSIVILHTFWTFKSQFLWFDFVNKVRIHTGMINQKEVKEEQKM